MSARPAFLATLAAVTSLGLVPDAPAAVGPDGRIAFQSRADGDWDVYVMDADGTGVVNLTDGPGGPDDAAPDWSPDGTRIAYTTAPPRGDDGPEIWVMDADGGAKQQLTDTSGGDATTGPRWSPDGTRIAYTLHPSGSSDSDVYTMAADGSDKVDVTSPWEVLGYGDYEPTWSPDGQRLVFSGVREGDDGGGAYEIIVANADGSGQQGIGGVLDHSGEVRWPSFSPDGQKIAYARYEFFTFDWDVWVMNPDGSGKENLTQSGAFDAFPSWSPDGTRIVFSSNRSGGTDLQLYTIPFASPRTPFGDGVAAFAAAPPATPLGARGEAADWTAGATAVADVLLTANGFSPRRITSPLGETLTFGAQGGARAVSDASGLGLFASGPLADGGTFAFRYPAAGTYHARDGGGEKARVAVPLVLARPQGATGASVTVTLALARATAGRTHEAQVDPPGAAGWQPLHQGPARRTTFTPAAPGTYRFRARLRAEASGAASGWSPPATYVAR